MAAAAIPTYDEAGGDGPGQRDLRRAALDDRREHLAGEDAVPGRPGVDDDVLERPGPGEADGERERRRPEDDGERRSRRPPTRRPRRSTVP